MFQKRNERIERWNEQTKQPGSSPADRTVRRQVSDAELFNIMKSTGAIAEA